MCGFVGFFTNGYGGDRNAVIKAMADRPPFCYCL